MARGFERRGALEHLIRRIAVRAVAWESTGCSPLVTAGSQECETGHGHGFECIGAQYPPPSSISVYEEPDAVRRHYGALLPGVGWARLHAHVHLGGSLRSLHVPAGGVTLREGIEGLRTLLAPGELRRCTLNYALISATGFFMFWFYQSFAREAALPVAANGPLGAGLNLLGMFLLWYAPRLETRWGLSRLLSTTAVLPGLLYLGLAALGRYRVPALVFPAAFLIVGMKLLRVPLLLSDLINRLVESRNRATMLSGVSMLDRAIIFALYPLVGVAADRSLSSAFLGLGTATLLFAALSRLPSGARLPDVASAASVRGDHS
jgi:hypothetical protein